MTTIFFIAVLQGKRAKAVKWKIVQSTLPDAILLELPPNPNEDKYVTKNSEALIEAILGLTALPGAAR